MLETQEQIRRLQRLLEAAILLNSKLSLKDLTEIILEIVRTDVPVERVTAFRVDHEKQIVYSLVAQEADEEIRLPIGSGIAGTVARFGTEIDVVDAYADSRFNPAFDQILDFHTRDLFALPVFNREGDVVGVLELLNRRRPIDETDINFLRGIAIYVGLALENAWLYQEALMKQKIEAELAHMRDRLAQMERVTMMAQAVSGVVHELNNPLAIAMGNLGLLKDDLGPLTEHLNHLVSVESAIDRTAMAVRRFVNLAGDYGGEYQPTDLEDLLRQIVELRRREWDNFGISATIELKSMPPIHVQEGQLQLAFMHLLLNAEDACMRNPMEKRIAVRAQHIDDRRAIQIEVEDNGPGIPKAAQEQVFKAFYTTKAVGSATGLGLTAVRAIVERHHGRVWFVTKRGRGTIFTVELPDVL
jgi:signal transduction histidine kinase